MAPPRWSENLSTREFAKTTVTTWKEFWRKTSPLSSRQDWIFRGQRCSKWSLESNLERALKRWNIASPERRELEKCLIREFQRQYQNFDSQIALEDTLYCMSVMQHYSAPTRLLDWTYSPYVAVLFAIERASRVGAVWCLSTKWCEEAAAAIVGHGAISKRNRHRDEASFQRLYMPRFGPGKRVAFTENASQLNPRLVIQQGLFLCPGDVGASFECNLKAMRGWDDSEHILKIELALTPAALRDFALNLLRMNVSQATLFPGMDGFGRSLADRIPFFEK